MNTITEYEKLPEQIRKHGNDYKLVKRNDKAAMYAQYTNEGLHIGYEVFIVKVNPSFTFPNGTVNPAKEAFPYDEAFGNWAWCYMPKNEAEALERYDEITNGILHPVSENIEPIIEEENKPKRSRGRPAKNPGVVKVPVVRTPRAKFVYDGKEYNSKSDVARILLTAGESKESIAKKLVITVQTVHAVSNKIKAGK